MNGTTVPNDLAGIDILVYAMNFAPEMTGCGRYTGELAFALAGRGATVTVVTTPPHYPGWKVRDAYRNRFSSERQEGVRILRCPVYLASEVRGWTRLAAPLSFALTSAPAILWQLLQRRRDLIVCVEPTLFAAPWAALVARLCGTRSLLHVQDLEIDGAFEVGHLDASGRLPKIAFAFERFVLRRFDAILTISNAMRRRIVAKGIADERVGLLRNWVDLDHIKPLPDAGVYRRVVDVPDDHFVVLYAGNLGAKQGLDLIGRAARGMVGVDRLTFVIAGEGPERERLEREYGMLPNVRFLGLQPERELGPFLNMPDVHIIPQLPNATDFALPSKLGGILASGRRLIVAANPDQELVEFLSDAATVINPDDADALQGAIAALMADQADTARPLRAALAARLSRDDAFDHLASRIRALTGSQARMRHVCFAGPLPPPTHGMSSVNTAMVTALSSRARVTAINSGPKSLQRGGIGYHVTRFARVATGLFRLAGARLSGARTLYASVDDGLGGIWTLAFVGTARLLGMRRFLHHHSFRYIDAPTRLMRTIVRVAGAEAEHVLLCSTMQHRFCAAYPAARRTVVVANTVPLPATDDAQPIPPRARTIGMLANLTFEKGLREFVALIEQDSALCGILAGPAPEAEAHAFIVAARARLGDRLDWRGPVHDAAKEAFFQAIDVFVFPTRYRTEAYPLVLVEALVRGVPVIAPDRGCIGALETLDAATIVPADADFVTAAAQALTAPVQADQRTAVRREGLALNQANDAARTALLDRLAPPRALITAA